MKSSYESPATQESREAPPADRYPLEGRKDDGLCIREVIQDKKRYLNLLLLADEQESMIDRYLEPGELFVLETAVGRVIGAAVVLRVEDGVCELKALAVDPACQRRGYGRRMVEFLCTRYRRDYSVMLVGTGDSPLTLPFYQACGFEISHRVPHFFTDHYDHPIIEAGRQLIDMVYLKKRL